MPDFEDGVSAKTFDDTEAKYHEMIEAIKYDSMSAEDAIKEMFQTIEDAAIANGDPWRAETDRNAVRRKEIIESGKTE